MAAAKHNKYSLVHGHSLRESRSPTYNSWASMLTRCKNKNSKDYKDYGARGITVCERWDSFENFLSDMGPRPIGTTLDRISNSGNYEPNNCRWATSSEQARNRNVVMKLTVNGETKFVIEWAKLYGLDPRKIRTRIWRGFSPEACLSTKRLSPRKGVDNSKKAQGRFSALQAERRLADDAESFDRAAVTAGTCREWAVGR